MIDRFIDWMKDAVAIVGMIALFLMALAAGIGSGYVVVKMIGEIW